jgi:hypothetical protein
MKYSVRVLTVVVVLNLFGFIQSIDYCDKGLCSNGKKHVACGSSIVSSLGSTQ